MIHPLDNPIWSALTSGNQRFALGNEQAKYYNVQVAPFAAVAETNRVNFEALRNTVTDDQPVVLFTRHEQFDPSPWKIINRIEGYQMLYEGPTPEAQDSLVALTEDDVPQMLALTKLSSPGPFLSRTIELGGYEGIFTDNRLVAMAGRRFDSGSHVEISAVCTHPDHTGNGYARLLVESQIRQIRSEGKIPYLHVRSDNTRAHTIYERMGFVTRSTMLFYIVRKS